jgi:hypothetical protein
MGKHSNHQANAPQRAGKGEKRVSTVRSAQYAITSTPQRVAVGNSGGSKLYLHSDGGANHGIFIGGANVTTTNGFSLHDGLANEFYLPEGAELYAIHTDAGSETLYVLQTGGI